LTINFLGGASDDEDDAGAKAKWVWEGDKETRPAIGYGQRPENNQRAVKPRFYTDEVFKVGGG